MKHLVAAPDKFRGTASAREVAEAIARAAQRCGWSADAVPLADGGEGLLDVVGGEPRWAMVTGPLGSASRAQWRLLQRQPLTAVIEMAEAAGRALVPQTTGDQPMRASTTGVGELVLEAVAAGAGRVIVGCGGSATTDGGKGAVDAIGSPDRLLGIELLVASDVTTPFLDAATVFGPQKGANPAQVALLSGRLARLARSYKERFEVDVTVLPGAGAAGGLAGGLAALGGRIVAGFDLVADLQDLDARLGNANLVVTGEGRLDPPSFQGKVVGGLISRLGGEVPVLCIAGEVDPAVEIPPTMEVISLVEVAGRQRSLHDTLGVIEEVVASRLSKGSPPIAAR